MFNGDIATDILILSGLNGGLSYLAYIKAKELGFDLKKFKFKVIKGGNKIKKVKKDNYYLPLKLGRLVNETNNSVGDIIIKDLAKAPHLLIGGSTGSGKGFLISNLINSLQSNDIKKEIYIYDIKGLDFISYENSYTKIIDELEEIEKHLSKLIKKEYKKRKDILKKHRVKNIIEYNKKFKLEKDKQLPFIIIIVDELAELILTFNGDENKKIKSSINNSITSITQLGRAYGIHAILSTQNPKIEVVNSFVKSNCSYKIGLRVENATNSRVIGVSKAHTIKKQFGFCYFKDYNGEIKLKIEKYH